MDKFTSNTIPELLDKKDQVRVANNKIAELWNRPVSSAEIKRVIQEKIAPLSENTRVYLYNLIV
jgi:hypothetical protein